MELFFRCCFPAAGIVPVLHFGELILAMLFRSPAFWQPPSSGSESDQDVTLQTPTKNRARSETEHSASKAPRPGAPRNLPASSSEGVSPGSSQFKSPGVQSNDLKSPGVSEVQEERQVPKISSIKSRAPPGVMGTRRGQRPPKRPAKRQVFEEMRVQMQQPKPKQPATEAKILASPRARLGRVGVWFWCLCVCMEGEVRACRNSFAFVGVFACVFGFVWWNCSAFAFVFRVWSAFERLHKRFVCVWSLRLQTPCSRSNAPEALRRRR